MEHYWGPILAALASSGGFGLLLQFLLGSRIEQAHAMVDHRLAIEHNRLDAARNELMAAKQEYHYLATRCHNPFVVGTVHVCLLDVAHVGVHTDGEIAWWGSVRFPPPPVMQKETCERDDRLDQEAVGADRRSPRPALSGADGRDPAVAGRRPADVRRAPAQFPRGRPLSAAFTRDR